MNIVLYIALGLWGILMLAVLLKSFYLIGETEVGLVLKKLSKLELTGDDPIAFKGEAGYQAKLLRAGLRFKLWPIYVVEKHPLVQVPPGEIGVVWGQIGAPLPSGAKSAEYKKVFKRFTDLDIFLKEGGQKGLQRPVIEPGMNLAIHPVAFLVITESQIYGVPISEDLRHQAAANSGELPHRAFSIGSRPCVPADFRVTRIEREKTGGGQIRDMIGIITTFEGQPIEGGDIASRIGGFEDIQTLEQSNAPVSKMIEAITTTKTDIHNNYQDFQAFLDAGGKIGLQHDPVLYGDFNFNPFLIAIDRVPMVVVEQGEVAVIKAYTGLQTIDVSGDEFMFGSLVTPGHRGIWVEPLRTGKYPINPHCYQAEIVPTSILTLNWADAQSTAHKLDQNLCQIVAKSREGFIFKLDLQVQIHVPDTKAPKVISVVGSMDNLVNEVLQAAVGNHFRDKLQSLPAVDFIEKRQQVQEEAYTHIEKKLLEYKVETPGVYIQDVVLPPNLVEVLTDRELAKQKIATFQREKEAEDARIEKENAAGTADQQKELAKQTVNVEIQTRKADARIAEAEGEASYSERMGEGEGNAREHVARGDAAYIRDTGNASAEAYKKQREAVGEKGTIVLNALPQLEGVADKIKVPIVPEMLISGGGSTADGLLGMLTRLFGEKLTGSFSVIEPAPEDEESGGLKEDAGDDVDYSQPLMSIPVNTCRY